MPMRCLLVEKETFSSPALITAAGVLDAGDKCSVGGEGGGGSGPAAAASHRRYLGPISAAPLLRA